MKFAILILALLVPTTTNAALMQASSRSGCVAAYGVGSGYGPSCDSDFGSRKIETSASLFTIDDDALEPGIYDSSVIAGANIGVTGGAGPTNWFNTDAGTVIEATGQVLVQYPFNQQTYPNHRPPSPWRSVTLSSTDASISLIKGNESVTWYSIDEWIYRAEGKVFDSSVYNSIGSAYGLPSPIGYARVVPETSTLAMLLVGLVGLPKMLATRTRLSS